ncbi:MAG: OPT/YSL family transporter, partial [Candidatus Eisenbacteria bacterium]|nr:OPT/YSL family transporter [Candidatus Eisenbacteria bacterium]
MATPDARVTAGSTADGGLPKLPPLPPDATPEQKDLNWYTHVYQGDRMPQLTTRAVLMGGLLGMLMSVSNLYTTLKVGWSFGVAITSCVMSYVIFSAFRTLTGGRVSQMSLLENNCMQSTASAAGYSTGATIATAFGALMLLDPNHRHQPWIVVASFTLATGAMGVFLAIPMKRQMINQEQLPFPSGIAAATTLQSLYSKSGEALHKAYSLVTALAVGAVIGVLNTAEDQFVALGNFFVTMRTRFFDVHLPEQIPAAGFKLMGGKPLVGFGFEPSVLLIAAGMIVGLRVSLSMLAASALLYFGVAPWLQSIDAANANVPGYIVSIPLVGGGTLYNPVRWALWAGTSIMVFASLTSL